MGFDVFDLLLSLTVFIVYGSICAIAILFTFFLDIYTKIDEKLNLVIIPSHTLTPLETTVYRFDDWVIKHNKILGPLLILLSLTDMKLIFNLIDTL